MSRIHHVLKKTFGYENFRFHQEEIIQSVMAGQDTLAIMPTGGGKSLCYQIPALCMDGITLVISPLISLMHDQVSGLNEFGVNAGFLNSTLDYEQQKQVIHRLKKGELKLLYVAPERVLLESSWSLFQSLNISLIAIDEAHCVSQWGHEFRKDYRRLYELKKIFPNVPIIALTATADDKTRQDICHQLRLDSPKIFISTFNRPNIKYMILERENEIHQLNDFISRHHPNDTGIVYCLSRKKVERVAESLCEYGYRAVAYHAGLTGRQRKRAQRRFDREDGLIVVATIAFGMGIDRPDVRFVAHLDLPKSIEGYYQETGRAGRDGEPANAWMIYGLADVVKLSSMLETTEAEESYKKVARHKLDMMLSLCESTSCRRQILLSYFGEPAPDRCDNCDTCLSPKQLKDATVAAQKLLSAVYRTGQFFGAGHVIDVLKGSKNLKVLQRKHDQLSVYGIGQDLSRKEWNRIIRQLLTLGYLQIKDWDFRNLALTEKSRQLLTGQSTFMLPDSTTSAPEKSSRHSKQARSSSHGRDDLFEKLRMLRTELAQKSQLPPYMIFSDKSLHDMCHILPQQKDEMLLVHGVGQNKLERYGNPFMGVIEEYMNSSEDHPH